MSNDKSVLEIIEKELNLVGPYKVSTLSKGLSGSEIIKVETPDQSYVVRFWNREWIDYFPQDLACQLIASEAGYGPAIPAG